MGSQFTGGFVDPMQPNRVVTKTAIDRSFHTSDNPQKKKPKKTKDEEYYRKKLTKYDFANNKNNTGKNCCDHFWWVIVSAIIFGIGAYVSRPNSSFTPF